MNAEAIMQDAENKRLRRVERLCTAVKLGSYGMFGVTSAELIDKSIDTTLVHAVLSPTTLLAGAGLIAGAIAQDAPGIYAARLQKHDDMRQ